MFIFGGTSSVDLESDQTPCEDLVGYMNLDLHEWQEFGEMSGPVPNNLVFHETHILDEAEAKLLFLWKLKDSSKLKLSVF